jgi:CheY-like chemotaxis protein
MRDVLVSCREPVAVLCPETSDGSGSEPIRMSISGLGVSAMQPGVPEHPPALPSDVLIVEDDPIIALDFEDTLLGFGVKAVRTAGSVKKALAMIADRAPDFALLDVGLVREKSFAIAERLEALRIPFAFVTGYGADGKFPAAFVNQPRLSKPYSAEALARLLKRHPDDGVPSD